jgi:hypothetical protein
MNRRLLILLFIPLASVGQLSDTDFEDLYQKLERQSLESGYIGRKEGQQNTFAEAFKRLSYNFTDDDLVYIGLHGNPVMRASAGKELVDRKSDELPQLFQSQLSATENVESHNGNTSRQLGLAAILFNEVAYQKEKIGRKAYYQKTMTDAQFRGMRELFGSDFDSNWTEQEADSVMQDLAEIALSSEVVSGETLSEIFRANNFRALDRGRVLHFVKKYPTAEVLAALAAFKNPADLPLLKKNYPQSYLGVSIYPHPTLFADLKTRLAADFDKPEYQRAVAAYKNAQAKALLDAVFSKIKTTFPEGILQSEKVFALHGIVEKTGAPLYDGLLVKWEKAL